MNELHDQYDATSTKLKAALAKAVQDNRRDNAYLSPLHYAIRAVDTWCVLDADERLLQIIDYEIDVASIPVGMNVSGEYLYPSVHALIRLRVRIEPVVDAISETSDSRQRHLLAYVLAARAGSTEQAKLILDRAQKANARGQNIARAIELLGRGTIELPPAAESSKTRR